MATSITKLMAVLAPENESAAQPRLCEWGHGSLLLRQLLGMRNIAAEAFPDIQRAGQRDTIDVMATASRDLQRDLRELCQPQIPLLTIPIPSWEAILNQAIQEALDAANPLARDIRIVRDPSVSEDEQVEALERLAEDVPWPPSKDAARGGAHMVLEAFGTYVGHVRRARLRSGDAAYAEQSRVDARRDLLGQAILEVLADFDQPQRWRFGSGKGSFFVWDVPARIPLADGWFHRWFHARVITIAECNLLGDRNRKTTQPPTIALLEIHDKIHDPTGGDLLRSLATRWNEVDDPHLLAVLAQLTPAEREICQLLVEGYDTKAIAALLGKAEATIRVQRHNIQKKAQRIPA